MTNSSDENYYELLTSALTFERGIGNGLIAEYFRECCITFAEKHGFFLIRKQKVYLEKLQPKLEEIRNLMYKLDFKILPIWSDKYPQNLKEIADAPACIYYKGDIDLLANLSLSVVGTRKASEYGVKVTKEIVADLVSNNFVITSGMAIGIDAYAHETTLDLGGKTIAVLVGGPCKASPAANRKIYDSILKNGGLVLSENLPESRVFAPQFASRNRIVAAISEGTVVIEADEKSGSLITAELAVDYGKHVFAVPGRVFDSVSTGTNSLIKKGHAKLIQNSADILSEFNINFEKIKKTDSLDLTGVEQSIYDLLSRGRKSLDEIQILLEVERGVILSSCTKLEFKNIVYKDITGKFNIV